MYRYYEAEPLCEGTHKELEGKLGPNHPETLKAATTLAALLVDIGKLGKALKITEDTIDAQKQFLSNDHPDVLETECLKAQALAGLNRADEAEPIYRAVLEKVRTACRVLRS